MGEERRIFILFNIVAKRVKGALHHSELASPIKPVLKGNHFNQDYPRY